jgi:hypothetical protein
MSESADRYRWQGLQLLGAGTLNILIAAGLLYIAWPDRLGAVGLRWVPTLAMWAAFVIGALGAFMVIGGSILQITADRPLFSGRRRRR